MGTDRAGDPAIARAESSAGRRSAALTWVAWTAALVEASLLAAALLVFPELRTASLVENIELEFFLAALAVAVMAFATAGLLVTRQQPRNTVGWAMLAGGPALGAVFVGYAIGTAIVPAAPMAGSWFVVLGVLLFGPALFLIGPGLASVFPDGRPLRGWWSLALQATAAGILVGSVLAAVAPGPVEQGIGVANPLGVDGLPSGVRDIGNAITGVALIGGGLVAAASLIVRFRRSGPEARHQLKWFLFAVVVWAIVLPISLVVGDNWSAGIGILALTLTPMAVIVAIRRYRLYEIDTLINRTLVYVPLVGIVAGLYAGLLALLQRIFTALTGDTSDGAAVISALVLAAVFTPLRNAIQGAVDRRFKPEDASTASQWDDPEFRAAVERIVSEVTGRPR